MNSILLKWRVMESATVNGSQDDVGLKHLGWAIKSFASCDVESVGLASVVSF